MVASESGIIRDAQVGIRESHFTFDLVPLSYESVDVVVGENWLLRHKAEMVNQCTSGFHRVNEPGEYESHVKMIRGVTEGKEKRGADDFVVYYDARSKDLKACLEKGVVMASIFTNEWDLASLKYSQETKGPYSTDLPTPHDIRRLLELERVMEELIRENVFGLGGHWNHLLACLAHMLYCVVAKEQYNLAYFFVKRIECARANPTANLPYGMFLTRLYRHIMEAYPHLDNGIYDIVDRVMRPLALKQTRRPRSDHGKARHSVLSSSSHHHGTSSHQHDDDDVKTSRSSTPSPITYLNSLDPLNYQNYQMPSASERTDETLLECQTDLLNQTQQMHKEMRGCDNRGLSRLDNQSIELDRLIGIGWVLDFVEFISFTCGDKEMILVIEAVSR
ncbi:hypothetical protein Tco_0394175 [Tanacetum coccineum]